MKKFFLLPVLLGFVWACQEPVKQIQEDPLPAKTSLAQAEITPAEKLPIQTEDVLVEDTWQEVPCETLALESTEYELGICKKTAQAYCAFFHTNRMYFCEQKLPEGSVSYRSNPWGSSLTIQTFDAQNRQTSEQYYAYGEMKRAANFEYDKDLISRIWWDERQIRLYQTNTAGRTLNKFYFAPQGSFIQYPDGNDMAEISGNWTADGNEIFIDGNFLYELPERSAAPDVCALMKGACPTNSALK